MQAGRTLYPLMQNISVSKAIADELRHGQMVYGKVDKIYRNQMADIQIGGMKMTAKVDAPISVDKGYWFQVEDAAEMKQLKVVSRNGTDSLKELASGMLKHFSIPENDKSGLLARFYLDNKIAISKGGFMQSLQWLNGEMSAKETLQTIKTIHALSLPHNEEVFKAIAAFENGVTLQSAMTSLLSGLKNESGKSEVYMLLKSHLSNILSTHSEKAGEKALLKLVNHWLSSEGERGDQVFRILQNLGFFPGEESEPLLQKMIQQFSGKDVLLGNPALSKAVTLLSDLMERPAARQMRVLQTIVHEQTAASVKGPEQKMWLMLQQNIPADSQPGSAQHMPGRESLAGAAKAILAYITGIHQDSVLSKPVLQLIASAAGTEGDFTSALTSLMQRLMQPPQGQMDRGSHVLQRLLKEEGNALRQLPSTILSGELKQAFKIFGLEFESYLASLDRGAAIRENELHTLKPLLMRYLHEHAASPHRDAAELLIQKLTAQQILSQSSGPLQHLIMQLPLTFGTSQIDVTVHWSGREKKDGSIDPSFCRVLFYLELEYIAETVVDLVVQNRVVRVTIINEQADAWKGIANGYEAGLKEKLADLGYQVSGFSYQIPAQRQQGSMGVYTKPPMTAYSGVDIKI